MSHSTQPALFILACALGALAPSACHAQSNAPLTGSMSGAASSAPAPAPASSPAAAMPDRPVVQQMQTPLPQA
ncbi:MAG TPA: DUF3613 domain-containing protein, partial [Achromobacter sp.]